MRRLMFIVVWSGLICLGLVLASTAQAGANVNEAVSTSTTELLTTDFCPQTDRDDDGGRVHTVHKQIKNVFGTVLAAYHQRVKWCYTGIPWAPYAGGKITWMDRGRWGTVNALGWDFEGHIGAWGYGGKGDKVALRGTQGKFRFCPSVAGCIQTKTPWIQHQVWGTGQYEWNTGW
jgi:hypothetical protein